MEEEDEISDVYKHHQHPEHSTENKLMDESEHYRFSTSDAFQELGEFDDSDLLRSLPVVEEAIEEAAPLFDMMPKETEIAEIMTETETETEVVNEAVVKEMAERETLEMDVAEEIAEVEAVKEATEATDVANETMEMEVEREGSEEEVATDVEAEASETVAAEEMTEMEVEREGSEEEVATDVEAEALETVAAEETTEMEGAMEESGADVEEDAAETEVMKEASESEVATEAPRPRRGGRKSKRGRLTSRVQSRAPTKRKEEEDVCFICFDGGNLVLCDRRGCPKAYHPSCVNRDDAFFKSRGRWNCGWHICSQCQKSAQYMCYTCTYSLCKGCVKEDGFVCVRGNKGFCVTCMRTVRLIEQNVPANTEVVQAEVDFDDKSNWEYLFKDYWLDLKGKLSITSEELTSAKNPWKGSGVLARNEESSGELYDVKGDQGSSSDSSVGRNEASNSTTRKKVKKQSKSLTSEESSPSAKKSVRNEGASVSGDTEWASNELLELVAHMKDGNKSVLSQYDVQALLLEYIKRNNLRDPRKKSQIICDSRLQSLFGKARVGHFEMLKLLESHFLIKDAPDDTEGGVLDGEASYVEAESNSDAVSKAGSDKRRKGRKRVDERDQQTNLDDYAAIDVHNINLVYLKRNLTEDLIDDIDKFEERVVGSFVRIRISGMGQKQDIYRLVQVVGTGRAAEAYKTGKKTTDVTLEILNLNKTEVITIDTISNQEFSEEECKRLRQSIKCGFISRLTVGEIHEKAKVLQAVRVKDSLEAELLRLSHLRDRASEHGRKKDLRECVEKLELLKTPEERSRRLQELPEVHADPNMDPSYISDEEDEDLDNKKQDDYSRSRDAGFLRKGREHTYPGKGGSVSNDGWNGARKVSSTRWELSRNTKGVGWENGDVGAAVGERNPESSWNQGRDVHQTNSWETPKSQVTISGPSPNVVPEIASAPSTGVAVSSSETDKVWHYKDPSGKIQGPFNMTQLRKWSKTGYFPSDLKIWKTSEKQEDSILLTDVLNGKFQKEPLQWEPHQNSLSQHGTSNLRIDASDPANGNADGWGTRSSGLAAPTIDSVDPKEVFTSRVPDSLKDSNARSSQAQNHSPRPTTPSFSGQSRRMPFHHARDGPVVGNASRWDSSQNRISTMNKTSGFQSNSSEQSGEGWKVQDSGSKDNEMLSAVLPPTFMTEGWGSEQGNRNDSSNLPTPKPKPSIGGTAGKGAGNMWSPSSTEPDALHSLTSQAVPEHPNYINLAARSNINLAAGSNATPLGGSGLTNSEVKDNSSLQLGSELTPISGPDPKAAQTAMPADGLGLVSPSSGATLRLNDLPSHNPDILLQTTNDVTVKGPVSVVPVSESLPSGNFVGRSNTKIGNWSAPSIGMAGQPSGWDVGSTAVGGNIQNNSLSVNAWQAGSAIEPSTAINTGWITMPTEIPNTGWGMMPENLTQGWGPAQVNANMSWGPGITQQGNAGTGWGTGAPGNTNMGWGVDAQQNANVAWGVTPQGNANAGLDPSAGNSKIWGNQPQHPGERFSVHGDQGFQASNSGHGGARQWNRSSGGGGVPSRVQRGQRGGVCKFHESGHCKKGASCDYLHT